MNTTQVTSTGIAVAVAVVIALGLLFFGPQIFSIFSTGIPETATAPTTASSTMTSDSSASNPLPTELTITDETVGTGVEATVGSQVTLNYVGTLPDGTVFDASANHGQAFTFTLGAGQVIQGWDQGIVGMKVGGKRHLVIPPALGYGDQEVGGVIPANSTLIFDVELVDVK